MASYASQIRPICVVDEARKWQDAMRACHGISIPCAVLCAVLHAFASAPACRGSGSCGAPVALREGLVSCARTMHPNLAACVCSDTCR